MKKQLFKLNLKSDMQTTVMNELAEKAGQYLPDAPLGELIDHGNIHQWLQDKITIVETRQSFLVKKLINNDNDAFDNIRKVYYNFGSQMGEQASETNPLDAESLFQVLNNYILEGMPCDRVNAITSKSVDLLEWQTERCVHRSNWENGGSAVETYYGFRASFTEAFIKAANAAFEYEFKFIDGIQYHTIRKQS